MCLDPVIMNKVSDDYRIINIGVCNPYLLLIVIATYLAKNFQGINLGIHFHLHLCPENRQWRVAGSVKHLYP